MKKPLMTRRHFLAGAGGAALAIPFLSSLLPRSSMAALSGPPRRFINVTHLYGHLTEQFFPRVIPMNRVSDHTYQMKLSDIAGDMSEVFDSRFNPYRAQMNIIMGMDSIPGAGHNSVVPLNGGGAQGTEGENAPPNFGQTIDILMAKSAAVYASTPRFPAIRTTNDYYGTFGVSWSRDKSTGVATRLSYLSGDTNTFNAIFGGAAGTPSEQSVRAGAHKTIVDKVFDRYVSLRSNPRLSSLDRTRLEQHVSNMQEVQQRLLASAPTCTPGGIVMPYQDGINGREVLWKNLIDVQVAALSCDMTRIAIMYIYDYLGGVVPDYSFANHHAMSHARGTSPEYNAGSLEMSKFKAGQIIYLLEKLSAVRDVDGSSLLDNVAMLWTAELSHGAAHRPESLPTATFGGAGGNLKNGYFLDMRQRPYVYNANRTDFPAMGQPYNRLLITMMRAMGMQPSEYMAEGDGGGFGEFTDSDPYIMGKYAQFRNQRNDVMPIIYSGS